MRIVSADEVAERRRKQPPVVKSELAKKAVDGDFRSTPYFGGQKERGPQGFRIDYGPHTTIHPHFHIVDQFQIFCQGSATVGKDTADPVTVHYTDAFTPYGPIVGGDKGFGFFNFRSRADPGAQLMPGAREKMIRNAGRMYTEHTRLSLADAGPHVRSDTLIDPEEDGLAALELVAGSGARLPSDVVGGSCRYELVLDGALEISDRRLDKDSVILAPGGERLEGLRAGPAGVHLLLLQLPHG